MTASHNLYPLGIHTPLTKENKLYKLISPPICLDVWMIHCWTIMGSISDTLKLRTVEGHLPIEQVYSP